MAYADPAMERSVNRRWYAQQREDPAFREAEARRVAKYVKEHREAATEKQRLRRAASRKLHTKQCPECGVRFQTADSRKVFDRPECQVAAANRRMVERRKAG